MRARGASLVIVAALASTPLILACGPRAVAVLHIDGTRKYGGTTDGPYFGIIEVP